MDELFGVSMTIIAFVCAALTAIILMVVGYLAWRNPVMFKNGIRNIPRRRSQTALIVVGLMLSTVIITAAFSIGDTLTHSVTSSAYSTLGPVDETVTWDTKTHPAPQTEQTIPLAEVAQWRQTLEGDAKAVVPFLAQRMPVLDLRTRLNQPNPQVVAAAADALAPLGGLRDTDGKQASLRPGDIALDQELAGKLDARVGDAVRLFYRGKQVDLTVSAIVPDTMLGGASSPSSLQGAAVNFDFLAGLTGDQGKANLVAISNDGSTRGGISATPTVKDALGPVLAGTPYQLNTVKKDSVDTAARLGSIFTTLFLVIGMFSIAAGILLIFLIFVMLAAERRPEMGMARAVGARRSQIVQSFLAEGMGYDLGSAVVGLGLGVGVAAAMTLFVRLAARGNLGGLDLTFTVAARSLVTAFCLGVIVTFIVVFFASWRASRMNITAAIRDLPDVRRTNPEEATLRGYLRGALNAFASFGVIIVSVLAAIHFRAVFPVFVLAAVAALPGFWLAMLRSQNFGASAKERKDGEGVPRWPLLLGVVAAPIGIGLVVLLTYGLSLLLVRYTRERRPAQISTPLLIGGVLFAPLGLVLAALQDRRQQVAWGAGIGAVSLVLGALMTQWACRRRKSGSSPPASRFSCSGRRPPYGTSISTNASRSPRRAPPCSSSGT